MVVLYIPGRPPAEPPRCSKPQHDAWYSQRRWSRSSTLFLWSPALYGMLPRNVGLLQRISLTSRSDGRHELRRSAALDHSSCPWASSEGTPLKNRRLTGVTRNGGATTSRTVSDEASSVIDTGIRAIRMTRIPALPSENPAAGTVMRRFGRRGEETECRSCRAMSKLLT